MTSDLRQLSPLRAAQYVRMSTEHQQYSTANQSDAIAAYATLHQMEIVQTYADHGRSGVSLVGRLGLQTLLDDVARGQHTFSVVLVYDVSRWGRFQDADESAYYEYALKKAGIQIHYCAEQFANDGALPSILFKTLKRIMAGEYSRELSVKVFAGQCRLIELGFHQGGLPGYGLRRLLIDSDRNPKARLASREHKSIQNDRVILVPGPEAEVAVVTNIYQSFITFGKGETDIAADLNALGSTTHHEKRWTKHNVHEILVNPKYMGMNLYNRSSRKLKQKPTRNPSSSWIACEAAFEPIVTREQFQTVQAIIHDRNRRWSDNEMLDGLRDVLKTAGRLTHRVIDNAGCIPRGQNYARRFGGLLHAYALVGWNTSRDSSFYEANRGIKRRRNALIESVATAIRSGGTAIDVCGQKGVLTINQEFTAWIRIARCYQKHNGLQWRLRIDRSQYSDVSVIARMNPGNESILDYYVFPSNQISVDRLHLRPTNSLALDVYRFDNLDVFIDLCRRKSVEDGL